MSSYIILSQISPKQHLRIWPLSTAHVLCASWSFLARSQRLMLLSALKSITLTLLETEPLALLLFLLLLLLYLWKHATVQLLQIIFFPSLCMLKKTILLLSQRLPKITHLCTFVHPFPFLIYRYVPLSNPGALLAITVTCGSPTRCNYCTLTHAAWLLPLEVTDVLWSWGWLELAARLSRFCVSVHVYPCTSCVWTCVCVQSTCSGQCGQSHTHTHTKQKIRLHCTEEREDW